MPTIQNNMESNVIDWNKVCKFNGRTIEVIFDENNDPWFRGKDVAESLEYANVKKVLFEHVSKQYKLKLGDLSRNHDGLSYNKKLAIFISESGLYELVMRSRMPVAELFKDWMYSKLLPDIRRKNNYEANLASHFTENVMDVKELAKKREEYKKGFVYFATSDNLQAENIYKVGHTQNLEHRLEQINSSFVYENDFMKYFRILEVDDCVAVKFELCEKLNINHVRGDFYVVNDMDLY